MPGRPWRALQLGANAQRLNSARNTRTTKFRTDAINRSLESRISPASGGFSPAKLTPLSGRVTKRASAIWLQLLAARRPRRLAPPSNRSSASTGGGSLRQAGGPAAAPAGACAGVGVMATDAFGRAIVLTPAHEYIDAVGHLLGKLSGASEATCAPIPRVLIHTRARCSPSRIPVLRPPHRGARRRAIAADDANAQLVAEHFLIEAAPSRHAVPRHTTTHHRRPHA